MLDWPYRYPKRQDALSYEASSGLIRLTYLVIFRPMRRYQNSLREYERETSSHKREKNKNTCADYSALKNRMSPRGRFVFL